MLNSDWETSIKQKQNLQALKENVKEGALLKTDGKTSYAGLSSHYKVESETNDYKNNSDHLKWLNTVVSNL